jgi:putative DNA primase/helicase
MSDTPMPFQPVSPVPAPLTTMGPTWTGLVNFPFTDMGNAQRLVARHGKDLRYCQAWKKWLVWDGKRWQKDDSGEVMRRAKDTMLEFVTAANVIPETSLRENAVKRALAGQSVNKLNAMIQVAQSEPGIPVKPADLDHDPYSLNCLNGTIDLKTGQLRKHRPQDLITKLVPVSYDPAATCPQFESFLAKVTGNDQGLAEYLQRAIGYSLTGDVTEKAMFFLYGDGNNGKTTFLEAIRAVLGEYAGQVPIESLMSKQSGDGIPNDIACLQGLRFVTSSEAEQGRKLAEAKVKQITGMGTLQARYLYGEYFEFTPTFKIFMDANHKPEIRGDDAAIWNRMKLVPFSVQLTPEEIDKQLPAKLREELPGILNWALKGCLEWQGQGLGEPKTIKEATLAYRAEMDTVAHFIEDDCDLGKYFVSSKKLYAAYKDWCYDHNEEPVSQKQLGATLKKKGLVNKKVAEQRGWTGIGLKGTTPLLTADGDGTEIKGYEVPVVH